jgi:uncharacterized membrane protein YgcG
MRFFAIFLLSCFFLPGFVYFLSMLPTNISVFIVCGVGFISLSAMGIASSNSQNRYHYRSGGGGGGFGGGDGGGGGFGGGDGGDGGGGCG